MKNIKVKVTFTEAVLGTTSGNKELYSDYIASKAPDAKTTAEEIEAFGTEDVEKKQMTVFPRLEDGTPFIYDYQIKGFFKNSCSALRKATGYASANLKAFKKEIDGLVFVKERKIPIKMSGEMEILQRPLRADTAQGPRVALASSESCPAGSTIEFTIMLLKDDLEKYIREWMDYGQLNGLMQWHNGGYGRFEWEEVA